MRADLVHVDLRLREAATSKLYQRQFASSEDFENALRERAASPGNSRLDQLAEQLGVSVQDLILAQNGLYK